jgi:hypothetical protein
MINITAIFFARSMGIEYPSTNPTATNLIESLTNEDSIIAIGRARLIFRGADFSNCVTAKDALFKLLAETYELVGRIERSLDSLISVYVYSKLIDLSQGNVFKLTDLNNSNSVVGLNKDILNLGRIVEFMTESERNSLTQGLRDSIEKTVSTMIRCNDFREFHGAIRKLIFLLSNNHDQFAAYLIELLLAPKVKESYRGLPLQLSVIIQKLLVAVDRNDTNLVDKLIVDLSRAYGTSNLISKPVEIFEHSNSKSMWDHKDSELWREQP